VLGRWARLDFLPPALGRAFLAPLRVPARAALLKRLTACGFVNFVNLTLRSEL
jgi:hypothetical protein